MLHPQHRWTPFEVRLEGGEICGCTVGVETMT
jgi:hypothetical protein